MTIPFNFSASAEEWEEPLLTLQDDMEEHHDTAFWSPGDVNNVNANICWVVHNCSISRNHLGMPLKTAFLLNPEAVDKEPIGDTSSVAHSFEDN